MVQDISEMVVRIVPQGIGKTTDELGDLSGEFEDTADTVGEQAGFLDDFAEKFQGSSAVVIAGLGVAAAGLLSQIPVIGEALGGLFAILEALQIRIDENLRPALMPLTDAFFDFADAIFEAEGPLGDLIDFLSIFAATALAAVVGLGLLAAGIAFAAVVAGTLGAPLLVIAGAILALSAVVALFAVAWKNNWLGIQDLFSAVVSAIKGDFGPLKEFFADTFNAILGALAPFIGMFINAWGDFLNILFATAEKIGARIRTAFEVIFDLVIATLQRFANNAVQTLENMVNSIIRSIPREVRSVLDISTVNAGTPFRGVRSNRQILAAGQRRLTARDRAIGAREGQRNRAIEQQVAQLVAALQNNPIQNQLFLDGKEIARNQEKFLGDKTSDQGRSNPL